MSHNQPQPDDLERVLESTRRNVRQLEMDTCRVRNDLTRLEVALEAGITGGQNTFPLPDYAREGHQPFGDAPLFEAEARSAEPITVVLDPSGPAELPAALEPLSTNAPPVAGPELHASAEDTDLSKMPLFGKRTGKRYRHVTSPMMASCILHGALILVIGSLTVATIVESQQPFEATFLDLGEQPPVQFDELDLGKIAATDQTDLGEMSLDSNGLDIAGPIVDDIVPANFESTTSALPPGDPGAFTPLPSDTTGVLDAGSGGLGGKGDGLGAPAGSGTGQRRTDGGRKSKPPTSALFFGTKSQGSRFVFVIDNSSSMKGGRLEMATAELLKTISGLTEKQSFYVIFVSDQTYPMFYPQAEPTILPASDANKNRLAAWLPNAILASGKNRELIKAMDMAASLQPDAVYLLWDGDLRYSDKVRMDVMTHLTRPNSGWVFTIHTLGMGATSLDAEQNLAAIALAHGGLYRRIDLPTARTK